MRSFVPLLLAAGFASQLFACRPAPGTPPDESLVLRSYDVPKGAAGAIAATLKEIFWLGEKKESVARSTVTPDGRLAVLAPANVHAGVQTLIDEVAKHPPTDGVTNVLHYYVLAAKPAAAVAPLPAGVGEIKTALDEIVRTQGPQTFTVAQRAELASMNGVTATFSADNFAVKQKAAQTVEGIDAMIEMEFGRSKVETRLVLTADRVVVLGTGAQRSEASDGATLYYVVRVAPRGS